MKKLDLSAIAFFFIGLFILASCKSGSYNPASFSIEKRKYSKGFHVDVASHKTQKEKIEEKKKEKKGIDIATASFSKVPLVEESIKDTTLPAEASITQKLKALYESDNKNVSAFKSEYKKIKKESTQAISKKVAKTDDKDEKKESNGGYAITSFTLSIIGLIVVPIIFGILAVIFGAIGLKKGKYKALAVAGIIIGIVNIVWGLINLAAFLAVMSA